jgi:hypothetical protein
MPWCTVLSVITGTVREGAIQVTSPTPGLKENRNRRRKKIYRIVIKLKMFSMKNILS